MKYFSSPTSVSCLRRPTDILNGKESVCFEWAITEKNDSLNLLNFFKVSGCNQFILAKFK